MLTIILNWIYILFTCFCMGFAFSCFSGKVLHYSLKRTDSILMAGLIIATVYSQAFSLFYRVNIEANAVLAAVCLVLCIAMRNKMWRFIKGAFQGCPLSCKILIPILLFAWCFFTSRGHMVTDSDLYHGQSIRWIEEYGVVKGLGNLHGRLGYNSSLFALSALYSMKFMLGRSLHTVNGLMAFLLSVMALDLRKCFHRKKMLLSDYARVGAVYYLTTIWDEVIAPSSDYAVMIMIFYIVIKWLTQLEQGLSGQEPGLDQPEPEDKKGRGNIAPYALLCVAGVFTLTLKLTAGLILLLVLKPAYELLKEKRWKETGIYLCLGLAVALPWLTRNVLITGWLFYPFPELDLFSVDWKMMDAGLIRSDAYMIKIWAKGANQLGDTSLGSWFPNWFRNEISATEKLLILADIVSCAAVAMYAVIVFVRKKWQKLDMLLVYGTVLCSYLFWQFSAPMMRYGYAYVLLLAALTGGYAVEKVKPARIIYLFFMVYGIHKLYTGCDYMAGCCLLPNYVWQETYGEYALTTYEIDGVTIYYPIDGSITVTGYDPFPSVPEPVFQIELRGDGLKDGFRVK